LITLLKAQKVMNWTSRKFHLEKNSANSARRKVRRFDVYDCDFGENIGSEINKKRPCVVLQNNLGNIHSSNTIVVPITNSNGIDPICVEITGSYTKHDGSALTGYIDLSTIRTVSKSRIGDRHCKLVTEVNELEEKTRNSLGLDTLHNALQNQIDADSQHIQNLKDRISELEEQLRNSDQN